MFPLVPTVQNRIGMTMEGAIILIKDCFGFRV